MMVGVFLLPRGGGGDFTLGALSRLRLFECFNETFVWRLVVQDFTRVVIHPPLNPLNLPITDGRDGLAFRDKPTDELVLVFAGALFI